MDDKPAKPEILSYLPVQQDRRVIRNVRFTYLVGAAMILGAVVVVLMSLQKYSKAALQSENLRHYLEADAGRYLLVAAIMTLFGFVLLYHKRLQARPSSKATFIGFSVLYAGVAVSYFGVDFGHIGPFIAMIGMAVAVGGGMVLLVGLGSPLIGRNQ